VEPTPAPEQTPRYARGVIWEPFVLAVILGLVVSAGLYFAYLWPSVDPVTEPAEPEAPAEAETPKEAAS
jgi:hypothetical protein